MGGNELPEAEQYKHGENDEYQEQDCSGHHHVPGIALIGRFRHRYAQERNEHPEGGTVWIVRRVGRLGGFNFSPTIHKHRL